MTLVKFVLEFLLLLLLLNSLLLLLQLLVLLDLAHHLLKFLVRLFDILLPFLFLLFLKPLLSELFELYLFDVLLKERGVWLVLCAAGQKHSKVCRLR